MAGLGRLFLSRTRRSGADAGAEQDFSLPPIAPLVVADNPVPDDAMMQPLRQEANAALQALQAHTTQQTASTF